MTGIKFMEKYGKTIVAVTENGLSQHILKFQKAKAIFEFAQEDTATLYRLIDIIKKPRKLHRAMKTLFTIRGYKIIFGRAPWFIRPWYKRIIGKDLNFKDENKHVAAWIFGVILEIDFPILGMGQQAYHI